jgi:predicted dehydrogenase
MVVAGVEEENPVDILSDHLCRRVRTRGERNNSLAEQLHVLVNLDICANTLSLVKTVTLMPCRIIISHTALPRIMIIGAGSRGTAYARAVSESGRGIVAAVAEPIAFKRNNLGSKYIWDSDKGPIEGQEFDDWKHFLQWETKRRCDADAGRHVPDGIDGILIFVLDEQHAEVITALGHLSIHTLCEKPLATTLKDCMAISAAMSSRQGGQSAIFGIGHVLRYSPHNMLLRKLVLEDQVIGPILSMEHTEPVGNWHFTHSYVR